MWRQCVFGLLVGLACAAGGCSRAPERPLRKGKPEAPVQTWIVTRDHGGGLHEVTLVAVPTTLVSSVDLEFRLPPGARAEGVARAHFGPTFVGVARRLVVPVRLAVAGADVAGAARVAVGARQPRMRPALARLGAPAPLSAPRPLRDVVLPSGARVAEARP